ncbi:insulinase family protein [Cognaticolwellia beringensis]|uniref:Peptidase M16 N-terminal domain-containing protein n=1 Tax=Cognaticolwellia beringensis TaxID=1967665 RepID=A0A222G5M2_9GAMM|nr:insulinase family protein [Cognaticolwellia beringensis]ASP47217.1 hypothetical protein B5D82_05260 [Cognaticolwellia beringensis]
MKAAMYRHENGLKHVNIINNDGFSALFVVNTPIFDNSGVAHGVEHGVFRSSIAFPQSETLFQLTSLTDAKINASTFADSTYFHCQSQCENTFNLAIEYLLNGLFSPIFDKEYLSCEVYDGQGKGIGTGKAKGVIYRELIGIEQANKASTNSDESENSKNREKSEKGSEFSYGGISSTIGELTLNDLSAFHQRFYQARNMILVTANADIEKISELISLLPLQIQQEQALKVEQKSEINEAANNDDIAQHQAKYSPAINTLINTYYLSLQTSKQHSIDNYTEIKYTSKALETMAKAQPKADNAGLIAPLVSLTDKYLEAANNERKIDISDKAKAKTASQTLLPKLFNTLCLEAKEQFLLNDISGKNLNRNELCKDELRKRELRSRELCQSKHEVKTLETVSVCNQHNALWLTKVSKVEQAIANITSYIVSAYPAFLARRCQGFCYATQALTIENSTYFAIYSAFDIAPDKQLNTIPPCLLALSEDNHFISASLALAKAKYCRVHQVDGRNIKDISQEDISGYLQKVVGN